MEILLGAAAGIMVAALCALFYRKGVRDGLGLRKAPSVKPGDTAAEAENELFRKYEMIMGYDPYEELKG